MSKKHEYMKYIESVDGEAHQSAIKIIADLEHQLEEEQSQPVLHKSVRQLANDMQYKLDKNKHKNTGWHIDGVKREDQGWLPPACPLEFLVRKYYEEIGEFMELLVRACLDGDIDPVDLRYEAADVANLVMMMRDSVLVMIDASIDRASEHDQSQPPD